LNLGKDPQSLPAGRQAGGLDKLDLPVEDDKPKRKVLGLRFGLFVILSVYFIDFMMAETSK